MNVMNFMNFVRDLFREPVSVPSLLRSLEKLIKSKGFRGRSAVRGELEEALENVHNVHEVHYSRGAAAETRERERTPNSCERHEFEPLVVSAAGNSAILLGAFAVPELRSGRGQLECREARGNQAGAWRLRRRRWSMSQADGRLDTETLGGGALVETRDVHGTSVGPMSGGARFTENTQEIYKKFPIRSRGERGLQDVYRKFPSRISRSQPETAKGLVVEHKGNA